MSAGKITFSFCLILVLLVTGCAGRESKSNSKNSGYVPLSEAEAKIYTTPTIYYIPQFDLNQQQCDASTMKAIKDKNDSVLFSVCGETYSSCLLQGTCELRNEGGRYLVNVSGRSDGQYKFSFVKNDLCSFGYGAGKSICLDPYHSVAADLSIYRLGQVIYIPHVVGTLLPDGSKHDGYFIVRDSGGNIKGFGRFDFFTGFNKNTKATNPFSQIGLAGKETHVQYYVMKAEEALSILKKRNYPNLPVAD